MRYLMGIESSCDDTSIAVVADDRTILANIVSSQEKAHTPYGGVVPELASRAHLENFPLVLDRALQTAGLPLDAMTAIAVTQGPGLIGSLMVGINYAKALAWSKGLPLVPVNHIRAHVAALFLEHGDIPLPALALIVSGGHTHLFRVEQDHRLVLLTKTRDDAAGEAFDKLSKMLGLGFPGGAIVDKLAQKGDPKVYAFAQPKFSDGSFDYSFSGMKTNAMRHIEAAPEKFKDRNSQAVFDLCASFQAAVVQHLLDRVKRALKLQSYQSVLLGGGVACNSALRAAMTELAEKQRLAGYLTAPVLSTDNAAMIAAEGWRLFEKGVRADIGLGADISLKAYDAVDFLPRRK